MTETSPKVALRFPEIDFIKGISIIWIVIFHMYRDSTEILAGTGEVSGLNISNVMMHGALGVDIFVVCSGFLLAHSYRGKPVDPPGTFLVKKVQRLLPLYYLSLFGFLLLNYITTPADKFEFSIVSLLLHMVGLHTFTPYIFDFEPAYWFIGLIIQLYLLFPFLLPLCRKYPPAYILSGAAVVTMAARFVPFANIDGNYSVFAFLFAFIYGIYFYQYITTEAGQKLKPYAFAHAVIAVFFFIYAMHADIFIFDFLFGMARPLTCIGLFLLLIGVHRAIERGLPILARPIALYGLWSYAIYLFHRPPIYKYVTVLAPRVVIYFDGWVITVSYMIFMLGVGFVFTRLETRFFQFIRR